MYGTGGCDGACEARWSAPCLDSSNALRSGKNLDECSMRWVLGASTSITHGSPVRVATSAVRPGMLGLRGQAGRSEDSLRANGTAFGVDRLTGRSPATSNAAGRQAPEPVTCFRHTMATLMLEGGADIRFIQQDARPRRHLDHQIYTQVSLRQLRAIHAATHPATANTSRSQRPDQQPQFEPTGPVTHLHPGGEQPSSRDPGARPHGAPRVDPDA